MNHYEPIEHRDRQTNTHRERSRAFMRMMIMIMGVYATERERVLMMGAYLF
jgi:hypothetical protein